VAGGQTRRPAWNISAKANAILRASERFVTMKTLHAIARLMFGRIMDPEFYMLVGVVCFLVGVVLPTQDRIVAEGGGDRSVITRQDNPLAYWGIEAGILAVGAVFFFGGIFCIRRKR
jgi:hypothetical protein